MKTILVLNTGSSSIKFKLFALENEQLLQLKKGEIAAIGQPEGPKNHRTALTILFQGFGLRKGVLEKIEGLTAIAHRVVYGGHHWQSTLITTSLIKELKKYNNLAPLHNPPILEVIKAVTQTARQKDHRTIDNYAVFDTGFFRDLPLPARLYALPYEFYQKYAIQRYGFHGLSHQNAYQATRHKFPDARRIITLHLGSGCSLAALKDGQVLDTSMGFTPDEGLMMGSRCGDLDPGVVLYLMEQLKMSVGKIRQLITEESGLLGISQASSEMKDILYLCEYQVEDKDYQPNSLIKNLSVAYKDKAKLALQMFIYRIQKYLGAYQAVLGGIDVLVFTGKIGAGSSIIRQLIFQDLHHLLADTKVLVVTTDEEYQIAKEILPLID